MPTCFGHTSVLVLKLFSLNSSRIKPIARQNRLDLLLVTMPESDSAQHTLEYPTVIVVSNVVIFFIMLIVQLTVGAVFYSDCPRQPLIPVYLVVTGVILLLGCCVKCNIIFRYLVSLFFFCWFIAGNVWIYSIYEPNYNKNTTQVSPYCNKTLYMVAFWTTNLTYVLLCMNFLSWFCCGQQQLDDDDDPRRPLQR
ncbi:transmembrane protein 272-like [Trachinotus anak]|uniref:transmembrane protein 272-like n=1 Tax=Trachinotus anak TaxID=443729 RepID=UPI0039F20E9A